MVGSVTRDDEPIQRLRQGTSRHATRPRGLDGLPRAGGALRLARRARHRAARSAIRSCSNARPETAELALCPLARPMSALTFKDESDAGFLLARAAQLEGLLQGGLPRVRARQRRRHAPPSSATTSSTRCSRFSSSSPRWRPTSRTCRCRWRPLLARAHALVPPQAMHIIDRNLRALVARPRPHLLTVGLAATLYSASRGVDAVRKALNLAYDVKESRPFWKTELLAFGMTIGGAALVLFGIAALIAGGDVGLWLAGKLAHRARLRPRLELAALAGDGAAHHVVRGVRLLPPARRRAGVQVHHAGLGARDAGLAAGDLGVQRSTPATSAATTSPSARSAASSC